MEIRPWNESGEVRLEDTKHQKCACGIMTRNRLRIPYSKRVYVVCNKCAEDIRKGLEKLPKEVNKDGCENN